MKQRLPQLSLRLDADPPAANANWRAGQGIVYLGRSLTLVLDTACRLPEQIGDALHLPLPPAATPRQIRDAAESWLRDEALRIFQQSVPAGQRIVLSFGKRADWVKHEQDILRCHWRLIEQPLPVIEQVLTQAGADFRSAPQCGDLFVSA